jgi:cysteine desulfurase
MDPKVIDVMMNSMQTIYGNPSSTHQFGRSAKSAIEKARRNIAKQFNAKASEIVFTAGGSEADNMILHNAVTNLGVERIVTSKIEHHAVLNTIIELCDCHSMVEVIYVDLLSDGSIDLIHLETILNSSNKKALVSLMYINNEIGNILDVRNVSSLCKASDALFHSDSVQAIGHYNLDVQELGIDFLVASAHKFHGPKGVGFAYFKKGFGIKPILTGGKQERGARAGTENVHGILGMEKAIELVYEDLDSEIKYIGSLKQYFIEQLQLNFPDIAFNGNTTDKINNTYSILNVRFPMNDSMLLFTLDIKGIAASGGSACQSGSAAGSHVLKAISPYKESKKTSIRFSISKFNTKEDIDSTIIVLKEAILVKS